MLFEDLFRSMVGVNEQRWPGNGESQTNRIGEMVKGWLCSGVSVAAIFDSKGNFVSVHDSENIAKAKARQARNEGRDVRIKRVTIR